MQAFQPFSPKLTSYPAMVFRQNGETNVATNILSQNADVIWISDLPSVSVCFRIHLRIPTSSRALRFSMKSTLLFGALSLGETREAEALMLSELSTLRTDREAR